MSQEKKDRDEVDGKNEEVNSVAKVTHVEWNELIGLIVKQDDYVSQKVYWSRPSVCLCVWCLSVCRSLYSHTTARTRM